MYLANNANGTINSTVSIQTVLANLEHVVRSGNEWKAKCPCHEDTKPSLSLKEKDGYLERAYCHAGCDKRLLWKTLHSYGSSPVVTELTRSVAQVELDLDLCHQVYTRLLEESSLLESDRHDLVDRGLSHEAIADGRFRSMHSTKTSRSVIQLFREFGTRLYKVPGFVEVNGKPRLSLQDGILIPVIDSDCRVRGFQVRTKGESKYLWLSSPNARIKSVCHIPLSGRNRGTVRITEGVLKSEVAHHLDPSCMTWGVPGVGSLSSAIPPISGLPIDTPIRIAFDSDWRTKSQVKQAIQSLYKTLKEQGRKVSIEIWDEKYKGIDDALLAGATITVVDKLPNDGLIRSAAEYEEKKVDWLWHGWLPRGMISVLEGDPSLGKSTFCADISYRITKGIQFPGDSNRPVRGGVLFLASEDDPARVIKPRLVAAGADLEQVYFCEKHLTLPKHLEDLEEAILQFNIKLVILDPFYAYLDAEIDSYKDQAVREVLSPMAKLAERTNCALLLIRHLTKATSSSIYRGAGSIAVIGQARVGMLLSANEDNEDERVLSQVKNNLAPKQAGWRFGFEETEDWKSTKVIWKGRSND